MIGFSSRAVPLYVWINNPCAKYCSSSNSPISHSDCVTPDLKNRFKTVVLLLHHGQPRTLFYAREYLAKNTSDLSKIPRWLSSLLIDSTFLLNHKLISAVSNYSRDIVLNQIISKYSVALQESLGEVIPEFAPISCEFAFLYEEPNINDTVSKLIKQGTDRIVLVPLYPHYSCSRTGLLLNEFVATIRDKTNSYVEGGKPVHSHRIARLSPVSFHCTAIDRWSSHPAAISHFYDSENYEREVWSSCQRLMNHFDNKYIWRLAWFSCWDQFMFPMSETISTQLICLQKHGKFHTLVVPICSVLPTFDSESVLPNLLEKSNVHLLRPCAFSTTLLHGLTELVKNHILGRHGSAQLSIYCKYCLDKNCQHMKEVLT